MISKYDEGFAAYFDGAKYSASTNLEWINGWSKAERESRCGWYDQYGEPNRERNKAFA
jgi:hypothetical protein